MQVGTLVAHVAEVFLPSLCLCCQRSLPVGDQGLCGGCWSRAVASVGDHCARCGRPVAEAPLEVCLTCHESPPPQLGTVVWGEHAGVVRDALLALKHARHDELAAPLGQRLALRLAEAQWIDAVDVVTAVPTHFLYTVKRGWSAASLLARVAARDLGKPFRATLRRCGLDRQVTGSRARRLALSASAFRARCRLDDQVVLLIDDVTTTGTTLAHAARALLGAQAAAVYCAALTYASDPRRLA